MTTEKTPWQTKLSSQWQNRKTSASRNKSVARGKRRRLQKTIDYFHGLCAYCQKVPYSSFDHFYSYADGGTSALANVVPCCEDCQKKKGALLPDEAAQIFPEGRIEEIRSYLELARIEAFLAGDQIYTKLREFPTIGKKRFIAISEQAKQCLEDYGYYFEWDNENNCFHYGRIIEANADFLLKNEREYFVNAGWQIVTGGVFLLKTPPAIEIEEAFVFHKTLYRVINQELKIEEA